MRNLQEQVKKAFCCQKLFWPFTVWINCSSDLKNFANSRPSASNFKSFSRSLEQFLNTVGQNNFGNNIPVICSKQNERKNTRLTKNFGTHFQLAFDENAHWQLWPLTHPRSVNKSVHLLFQKERNILIHWRTDLPHVDLYLISEKSIRKNPVRWTWFLVYFELAFYCLCSLQKSISKLIFAG